MLGPKQTKRQNGFKPSPTLLPTPPSACWDAGKQYFYSIYKISHLMNLYKPRVYISCCSLHLQQLHMMTLKNMLKCILCKIICMPAKMPKTQRYTCIRPKNVTCSFPGLFLPLVKTFEAKNLIK